MGETTKVAILWSSDCDNWDVEAVCEVDENGANVEKIRLNGFNVPVDILTDEICARVADQAWDTVHDIDQYADYEYDRVRDLV